MLLNIYSLKNEVIQKEAKSVSVQTPNGEITVLENHEPLITPLVKGVVRIVEASGKTETVEGGNGFIEVRPFPEKGGEVNILID
jgi:F0F1-type ATP synthase epsilon subunit